MKEIQISVLESILESMGDLQAASVLQMVCTMYLGITTVFCLFDLSLYVPLTIFQ